LGTEQSGHRWADFITKAGTAIGALLAGVLIPVVINHNQEKNRETQLYVQIMTQREQSDSALRSQMFNALIGSYFGQDVLRDPEKQMVYLHLLTLNFQDFFDARPLYEDLNKRVTPEQRERLAAIAQDAPIGKSTSTKPDHIPVSSPLRGRKEDEKMGSFSLNGKENLYPFAVSLLDVNPSEIRVRVSSASENFNFKTIAFTMSYFDTPFMNNTKLVDGSRFAFVLRNADPERKIATIEVVTFPEEYMNLRDRPYFDEMLSRLGTKAGGAQGKKD
jgi:hypothetical protein